LSESSWIDRSPVLSVSALLSWTFGSSTLAGLSEPVAGCCISIPLGRLLKGGDPLASHPQRVRLLISASHARQFLTGLPHRHSKTKRWRPFLGRSLPLLEAGCCHLSLTSLEVRLQTVYPLCFWISILCVSTLFFPESLLSLSSGCF
jgi:hypothetical protein